MKLISWNVNGLRACLKKGFMDFFNEADADIFCIQETKMQEGQAEIDLSGYFEFWNSAEKKGYSGTAIFSKIKPINAVYGIGIPEHDKEGRVIALEFERFYIVNVYTPNSQRELARLDYRMTWEDEFRNYMKKLDELKPVIICGDLNCAHTEKDIKNAKTNERNAGYTIEERNKLTALISSGFTDFFRKQNPNTTDAFTWWSYMKGVRERNVGWRIDYFLGSDRLTDEVKEAYILPQIYGSDHCPVGIELVF